MTAAIVTQKCDRSHGGWRRFSRGFLELGPLSALIATKRRGLLRKPVERLARLLPSRPITMIVPFDPEGPTDTVGRVLALAMSEDLGLQVLVQNVYGAGGTLGASRVARADPDGYTVLLWHIGMASTATLYRALPFDAETSFAPIGLVSEVMTLIGRQRLLVGDWPQLLAYLQRRGEEVFIANAGIGSASHLCSTLFQNVIGVKLTSVPYTGTAPAMQDLSGDYVDLMCDQAGGPHAARDGSRRDPGRIADSGALYLG